MEKMVVDVSIVYLSIMNESFISFDLIPDFGHKETGKYLDDKM